MTDLMKHLHESRPTAAELDQMWPAEARNRVLARVQDDGTPAATAHTRRRTAWLGAAAALGAVVLVPNVIGSGAAQAELKALAMAAVSAEGPTIAEGTYLHVKTESVQRNSRVFGDGRTSEIHREMWIRWDGTMWAVDRGVRSGITDYNVFESTERSSLGNPTPEFAASLPSDADALGKYLHEHVQGSNSHEEAMFVAVTDLAHSNFLPPQTLAAALEVLAEVDGVEAKDVVVRGRDAVELSFSRFFSDLIAKQTFTLDKETARVISVRDSDPGSTYESETTLVEVVDRIPQEVLDTFAEVGDGARVYDEGRTAAPGDE